MIWGCAVLDILMDTSPFPFRCVGRPRLTAARSFCNQYIRGDHNENGGTKPPLHVEPNRLLNGNGFEIIIGEGAGLETDHVFLACDGC